MLLALIGLFAEGFVYLWWFDGVRDKRSAIVIYKFVYILINILIIFADKGGNRYYFELSIESS
jgi:hypothetical protein